VAELAKDDELAYSMGLAQLTMQFQILELLDEISAKLEAPKIEVTMETRDGPV
jgi:hypothetical protein